MKDEKETTAAGHYEWVWTVTEVNPEPDEKVPMSVGDKLYICVCDAAKAHFIHRTSKDRENTPLWNGAVGDYCAETGILSGTMPDKTTFKMHVKQEADGRRLIFSEHRRNPGTGNWGGNDGGPD